MNTFKLPHDVFVVLGDGCFIWQVAAVVRPVRVAKVGVFSKVGGSAS